MVLIRNGLKYKKVYRYRLVLFDLVNNRPLAEDIYDKENKDIIRKFLITSVTPKDRKAIITDKGTGYESLWKN